MVRFSATEEETAEFHPSVDEATTGRPSLIVETRARMGLGSGGREGRAFWRDDGDWMGCSAAHSDVGSGEGREGSRGGRRDLQDVERISIDPMSTGCW